MNWLRSLFAREPENRGTLTMMADGSYLLGMPNGATDEMTYNAVKRLGEYLENPDRTVLVFSFPVDVVDHRGVRPALSIGGVYGLERPLTRIARVLETMNRKTHRRRPRIIECQHPELHPEL